MTRTERLVSQHLPATVVALGLALLPAPSGAQLGATGTQFWNEGSPGLPSALEADARFGSAVAAGDFDCNGFDDLVVGVPGHDAVGGVPANVGYLLVLYGGWSGPTVAGHQIWTQQMLAAQLDEADDEFGEVLSTGDFNGDDCDDLVIGAPREDIGTETDAGGLQVVYGGLLGLTDSGNAFIRQGMAGLPGAPEAFDGFGTALAVADFDADGIDDLAVGVPGENLGSVPDAGAVHVIFGSAGGLTPEGTLLLYRGHPLPGAPDPDERLGSTLAAGQFGGKGPGSDVVIGAPFSSYDGSASEEGRVLVHCDVGSDVVTVSEFTQTSTGVPGASEAGDHFGGALAAGDFDGDGFDEVIVGSPGENIEVAGADDAGAVTLLQVIGGSHHLLLQEDFPSGAPSDDDAFGRTLAVGDFDADGLADLAIGVPGKDQGASPDAGIVYVVQGAQGGGFDLATAASWIQPVDLPETGDQFGFALAAGHFSGHSGDDLAIGAPQETLAALVRAGAASLIFSDALFLDGFESGDSARWSSTVE